MNRASIVVLFIMVTVILMVASITVPAVVIMLVLGALHASGLDGVPALSFFQSCLVVALLMTVAGLLRAAAGSYVD
ncbi:hypothetical protein EUA66_04450 [TM7 phylum sp. oral taxon 349]|nr:hypothetical protein EUA66_04450 [TM7 phylum sp. oral taxon 349]